MQTFNFPYHTQSTEYPESGTRVQLGSGYIFTSPPNGPDLRRFNLKFEAMKYFTNDEPTSTNVILNSVGAGAVAGTPGTLPAPWWTAPVAGISYSVVGSGVDDYGPYVEVRTYGTNTSGATTFPGWGWFYPTTAPAATVGQTWTASVGVRLVSGSANLSMYIYEYTAEGAYIINSTTTAAAATATPRRFIYTRTLSGVTVGRVRMGLQPAPLVNNASIDVTLRLYVPQLELGPVATSPIPTTTTPVTRTQGSLTATTKPEINMAALEKFYRDHKLHKTFIYPHPVYGDTQVKFYSPLKIPEGIVGGNGVLKDFSVELIEIIQ